jgi:eukaryotic-like serine/threonine-protein kinase
MGSASSIHDPTQPSSATPPIDGDETTLAPGVQVGEYELTGKLGQGGFGSVYAAVHPLIGKKAAVKVLNREFSASAEMVSRFVAEARAVNTIRHKNIIDIFNFGQLDDGRHYFVMELLDGSSLDHFIKEEGALEPALALTILRAVAKALDAAHAKGIVHRDLKPDNIYLTYDDEGRPIPKLLDFGIAKLLGEAGEASRHHTQTGAPVGTPNYMAPEQCLGDPVDERVDIYAYGVVCFEALTGRAPFEGKNFLELMNKQTSAERPNVSDHAGQPLAPFDEPVKRMMAREKVDRPETLADCYALLEAAARQAGVDVEAPFVLSPRQRSLGPPPISGSTISGTEDTAVPARTGAAPTAGQDTSRASTSGGLLVGGAVALGVVAYLATSGMNAAPAPTAPSATATSIASVAPSPTAAPSSSAASSASAPPTSSSADGPGGQSGFAVTFDIQPVFAKATVHLSRDGKTTLLSEDPGGYRLRGEAGEEVTLVVRAPGFFDWTKAVTLAEDLEVDVRLRARPKLNEDLEDPF